MLWKKIIILIGVFFCFHNSVFANENGITEIVRGKLVPVSFLNTKVPVRSPHIYHDDASFLRFVNFEEPLTQVAYRPKELVSLSGANINQAGRRSFLRAEIKDSLDVLAKDFSEDFWESLVAISAFRSAEYQQRLWDLGRCNDGAFCAKPWYSEHQLGLAIDFFDATSETEYVKNPRYKAFYEWMKKNAYNYGWTQSYKHWPQVDGYEIEPWHWRYVGKDMATLLHNLDMSYTRYLYTIQGIMKM